MVLHALFVEINLVHPKVWMAFLKIETAHDWKWNLFCLFRCCWSWPVNCCEQRQIRSILARGLTKHWIPPFTDWCRNDVQKKHLTSYNQSERAATRPGLKPKLWERPIPYRPVQYLPFLQLMDLCFLTNSCALGPCLYSAHCMGWTSSDVKSMKWFARLMRGRWPMDMYSNLVKIPMNCNNVHHTWSKSWPISSSFMAFAGCLHVQPSHHSLFASAFLVSLVVYCFDLHVQVYSVFSFRF